MSFSELPAEVWQVFDRSITVEYTSLTRAGAPVMVPVTPYVADDRGTLDVSTGLAYPTKAERARRNPKVSLLYSDPVGSGLNHPPVVLVQGLATVRDTDLQANTDRYVRLVLAKVPAMFEGQPRFLLRTLDWYFSRIWIQVTPVRVWWWGGQALGSEPGQWDAPPDTVAPASDSAPPGKQAASWTAPPSDWRTTARDAIPRLEQRSLAWVGADGFPLSVPVTGLEQTETGFRVQVGPHPLGTSGGPACVTVHSHPEEFSDLENRTFLGQIKGGSGECYDFVVERALADFSLVGNKVARALGVMRNGRKLKPRVASEAGRRGQPVPRVRLP